MTHDPNASFDGLLSPIQERGEDEHESHWRFPLLSASVGVLLWLLFFLIGYGLWKVLSWMR